MTDSSVNPTIQQAEQVSDKVLTLPNIISFVRLCLVPIFLVLLLNGYDIFATIVFAIAASTDFVDGLVARSTHTVSRLGQLLDPVVDRVLMVCGVLGVFLVGRVPLWIIVFVVARDLLMVCGGAWLLRFHDIRIPVIYPGKVATTLLFVGFAGLLLNMPLVPGLGITDAVWLPGFTTASVSWGIWLVYAGLVLAFCTTIYYCVAAARALIAQRRSEARLDKDAGLS